MSDSYHATIASLSARIEALEADNAYLKSELGLVIDESRVGRLAGDLHIPPQAARLLVSLIDAKGRLLSRDYLWQTLPHPNGGEEYKKLDVYISAIRRALGFNAIGTVHGMGYRLTAIGKNKLAGGESLTLVA